jgi:hypothetical protein
MSLSVHFRKYILRDRQRPTCRLAHIYLDAWVNGQRLLKSIPSLAIVVDPYWVKKPCNWCLRPPCLGADSKQRSLLKSAGWRQLNRQWLWAKWRQPRSERADRQAARSGLLALRVIEEDLKAERHAFPNQNKNWPAALFSKATEKARQGKGDVDLTLNVIVQTET